ncbi:alpha/beta hydrolase family protein [Nitriliruptor alkaliphilus]|uniref:alpha/beta hydrolase family protein n=1 Tax=Nitriliruptor alkaliphilus TaxID=427918 RepID=UPI0006962236|nr:CocE/NonD family hydrolase [Nitriliruptor alkaliphilus]
MLRRSLLVVLSVTGLVAPATAATAEAGPTITHHVVTSFDDTPIEATLFLPAGASDDAPVPLVLRTHGWAGTGETEVGSGTLARLLDEGYAVLTWDQRGFGCSGGVVHIDDPDVEGRDVSALIDWAVANAPIARVDGDPIVGMTGGSYAGGIQVSTAAVDDRLDALAPEILWSDLRYSLSSGSVVNQGWVAILYSAGKATAELLGLSPECASGPHPDGGLHPAIDQGLTEFLTTGAVSADTLDFFATSSLAWFGQERPVAVPTLVLQGSVDTLFDLTDGYGVYQHVRDQGVDARFVAFCGGHVACPASYVDAGDRAHLDDAIVAWFARHLRGEDVDTGSPVEYRTNEGVWRSTTSLPAPGSVPVPFAGEVEGLPVVPVVDLPDLDAVTDLIAPPEGIPALPITSSVPTPDGDPRGVTFPVAVAEDGPLELFGIPDVSLSVSGVTAPLDQVLGPVSEAIAELGALDQVGEVLVGSLGPLDGIVAGLGGVSQLGGIGTPTAHVFVKFVHREAGEVVNLQEGAIAVDLAEGEVTVEVPMPGLAYTLPEGHHLDVQVATNSLMHATGRVPALLDVRLDGAIPAVGTAGTDGDGDGGGDGSGDGSEDGPGRGPGPGDTPGGPGDGGRGPATQPAAAPLPVTGGSGLGLAALALLGAATLRRRPADRP